MAINLFVTNIPNGTSLTVLRGTAIELANRLIRTGKVNEQGELVVDNYRLTQFAQSLGVEPAEAFKVAQEIKETGMPEEAIDRIMADKEEQKDSTLDDIRVRLAEATKDLTAV